MQFWPAAQNAPETQVSAAHCEVGVPPHDHRRVGAELHADLLQTRLARDPQPGLDAAGEGDHPHPRIGHQGVAQCGRRDR